MHRVFSSCVASLALLCLCAAAPVPALVTIDNFSFSPVSLSVPAGTTVHWINSDDIPHTVTSAETPRRFGSLPLDTGDGFDYRFERPGTYAYFCSLHAHMQGVVIVR